MAAVGQCVALCDVQGLLEPVKAWCRGGWVSAWAGRLLNCCCQVSLFAPWASSSQATASIPDAQKLLFMSAVALLLCADEPCIVSCFPAKSQAYEWRTHTNTVSWASRNYMTEGIRPESHEVHASTRCDPAASFTHLLAVSTSCLRTFMESRCACSSSRVTGVMWLSFYVVDKQDPQSSGCMSGMLCCMTVMGTVRVSSKVHTFGLLLPRDACSWYASQLHG